MIQVLTISHTCPICGESGLKLLLERNLKTGLHYEVVCSNEYYEHIELNGTHYFVRKFANIAEEREDYRDSLELNLQFNFN